MAPVRDRNSPFMVRFAQGMADRGVSAATFDFPYMAAKRGAPDKPAVLEASWRAAVDEARGVFEALPLFIGGKSMGGRIASHIASQGLPGLGRSVLPRLSAASARRAREAS